mmetsp:Transcript_24784/g.80160  ORF Transcript_24784/g.80160 Transcript_24784/m.80160 type:complete len:227 (-) Transcript_24784:1330-2010(-)
MTLCSRAPSTPSTPLQRASQSADTAELEVVRRGRIGGDGEGEEHEGFVQEEGEARIEGSLVRVAGEFVEVFSLQERAGWVLGRVEEDPVQGGELGIVELEVVFPLVVGFLDEAADFEIRDEVGDVVVVRRDGDADRAFNVGRELASGVARGLEPVPEPRRQETRRFVRMDGVDVRRRRPVDAEGRRVEQEARRRQEVVRRSVNAQVREHRRGPHVAPEERRPDGVD